MKWIWMLLIGLFLVAGAQRLQATERSMSRTKLLDLAMSDYGLAVGQCYDGEVTARKAFVDLMASERDIVGAGASEMDRVVWVKSKIDDISTICRKNLGATRARDNQDKVRVPDGQGGFIVRDNPDYDADKEP